MPTALQPLHCTTWLNQAQKRYFVAIDLHILALNFKHVAQKEVPPRRQFQGQLRVKNNGNNGHQVPTILHHLVIVAKR